MEKANIYGILVSFQRCDALVKPNLRQLGEICGIIAVIRKVLLCITFMNLQRHLK